MYLDFFDEDCYKGDIYCCCCGVLLCEGSFSSQGWFCLDCNMVYNHSKVLKVIS